MTMSGRTQKSVKNIFANILYQVLTILLTFILRSVFIYVLGVEYLGLNGLFADVLSLLSMADLGFNTAMVYSYYKPLADKDYKKMAALTFFYKKVYGIIAIAIAVIGIIIIPFLPYVVNTEKQVEHLTIYYLLSLSGVIVSYMCVYRTSILTADQNNYVLTRIRTITDIIKTILQVLILLLFKNYILYLAINVLCSFFNNIYASYIAKKRYPFIVEKELLSKNERKEIFNNIKSIFFYKVSSVLLNATDNIIISALLGTIIVGYYSNYLMLQTKIVAIFSVIFTSLTASIGNLVVTENEEKRYEVFCCEQSFSYILSGVIVPCFAGLANDFINVWIGKEYLLTKEVVFIISINLFLNCVLQPLWSYREATGMYVRTKWVMVICALINLLLSVLFGWYIGLAGVLLASAIARIVTYVWYEPRLLFEIYFKCSVMEYFKGLFINACIVCILCISMIMVSFQYMAGNWVELILKGIILFCVCGICILAVYRKTDGFKLLMRRIKKYYVKIECKKEEY